MKIRRFIFLLIFTLSLAGQTGYALEEIPASYPFPWKFKEPVAVADNEIPLTAVTGMVVPHHMVVRQKVYEAYKVFAQAQKDSPPEVIVLVSPNHYEAGKTNVQMNSTGFRTRFGTLEVDEETEKTLDLPVNNFPFYSEHGISAEVDFIKYFFPEVKVVPIILKWNTPRKDLDKLAKKIAGLQKRVAIIASIDFSHYQTESVADFHDLLAENAIQRCDTSLISKLEIDSRASLYLLFKTLKNKKSCSSWILSHTNSQQFSQTFLTSTTSHFMALFGAKEEQGKAKSVKKIAGLYTVIHKLSKGIAGQEDRFFMGNDEVFLKQQDGSLWRVDKSKKEVTAPIENESIKEAVKKGDEQCQGKDFGIVRGKMTIWCFEDVIK